MHELLTPGLFPFVGVHSPQEIVTDAAYAARISDYLLGVRNSGPVDWGTASSGRCRLMTVLQLLREPASGWTGAL